MLSNAHLYVSVGVVVSAGAGVSVAWLSTNLIRILQKTLAKLLIIWFVVQIEFYQNFASNNCTIRFIFCLTLKKQASFKILNIVRM